MADMSLDDIMSDKPFEAEEVAEETTTIEQAEVETTEADQEEPEQAETLETEDPEPKTVPLKALQDERQKNRTMADRLAQIEQMLQSSQKPSQAEQAKLPDMFEQPEAYSQAVMQMMAQREANLVAEVSERFAREKHTDEVVDAALETAKAAGVVDQFRGKRDPWGELVKWHKQHQVMSEIGADPDAWRAQERERMRQELMTEMAGQQQKQLAGKAGPSLAGQANLGSRTKPAWSGPTPLSEILKG